MFILETNCFITPEQDKIISQEVLGSWFPWYYNPQTTSPKYFDYGHVLMKRSDLFEDEPNKGKPGIIASDNFHFFFGIFENFCKMNDIKFSTIHRSNLNCSFYMPEQYGDIHIDHNYPHYNFILYLNDFSQGSTYLFNDDNSILKEITASKYKAAVFDGLPHSQGFCAPGERRIVCVITFS
jgi:hypothetical protein